MKKDLFHRWCVAAQTEHFAMKCVAVSSQVKYAKIRQKVYHLWASGKGHLATKYTSLTWLAGNRPVVFQAVAVAGHVNNLAVVDQTVQDRCGNRCIPQEVRPLIKALVGCNYQRRLL